MEIGMVGLGRMGGNMAHRLVNAGHSVLAFDRDEAMVAASRSIGASGVASLDELAEKLSAPRAVWVMVPSGQPTGETIQSLASILQPGDVVLDGGNSHYKDSIRRGDMLASRGIEFLDVGSSGGVWGLVHGYALMVGGKTEVVQRLEPIFRSLAPSDDSGYAHVGPSGAGHFVKMVHNGIEYGLMQAYAEGFELMAAKEEFDLDLARIAESWREGSVVRSWLLELTAAALKEEPGLESLRAYVDDSGEGRWTVQESVELGVPAPVITLSLQQRFRSRQEEPFGAKLLAALRNQFGGHAVRRSDG